MTNLFDKPGYGMRSCWRSQVIVLLLIPITLTEYFIKRKNTDYSKFFTYDTFVRIFVGNIIVSVSANFFIISSHYTLISHTAIFGNLAGVLIVIYSLIVGQKVHKLETIGTSIIVGAAIIFINDSKSSKTNDDTNIVLGDMIAMLC